MPIVVAKSANRAARVLDQYQIPGKVQMERRRSLRWIGHLHPVWRISENRFLVDGVNDLPQPAIGVVGHLCLVAVRVFDQGLCPLLCQVERTFNPVLLIRLAEEHQAH